MFVLIVLVLWFILWVLGFALFYVFGLLVGCRLVARFFAVIDLLIVRVACCRCWFCCIVRVL